ncbi:DUF3043 domain-containing protein [Corynebacterium sp. L4756]|uniref:DUF3043 domain-containing protein n=1 Tax=unclassified Corynebacterium TaxID=2624378 RepID=UPI00374DF192
MKLPWQKDKDSDSSSDSANAQGARNADGNSDLGDQQEGPALPKGYTPPKGRPTPKRDEQEIAKGVKRDPRGMSSAQMASNRKALKQSMSKEEWKEYKKKEREERREQNRITQERMASGDERYLMPRDKGEVRGFVRDWVDSRRFINEWAMPAALIMLLIMFLGTVAPAFANIASILAMLFIVVLLVEGIYLGRSSNKAVRAAFPGTTEAGVSLGFYAYSRATQPYKWRTPRPRVQR